MKPSMIHFLLFSLLLGVLGAMPLLAQQQEGQDRHRDHKEHFLPLHKTLPHHDRSLDKHSLLRLSEGVRERLMREWGYDELEILAPYDRERFRFRQGLHVSRQTTDPIQHLTRQTSSDSVEIAWIANYTSGFPVPSSDYAIAIALDGTGNVYVTGLSYGSGTFFDYATVKYSASGVQEWVARYNGPGNSDDIATAVAVDGSGNVYVTGYSYGSGTDYDYATVKYNASGVQEWVGRYNGPGNDWDRATAIAVDGSGNVYVTGWSYGLGTAEDYATVKYNASGVQEWVARYNGPGNVFDNATAIAVDGSGNVYVTGGSYGFGTDYDYATVKYNASGVQQWVARYNGPGNDFDDATAIAVDGSGNVYVTGVSYSSGTFSDYATVKYNASGVERWVARYNGPGNFDDRATAIALDGSGNVYVTGTATFADGYRYTTIKYSQIPTGYAEEPDLPRQFVLHQNYPNPFNPATVIRYQLPVTSHVTLKIFNALGQEVAELVNEEKSQGVYEVNWNAEDVGSGVYFYRLSTPGFTQVRKLLLMR